jgi:hypothetical protein
VRQKLFLFLILLGSLAWVVGCSSSSGTTPSGIPSGSSSNVLEIAVDGGPTANQSGGSIYANGAFASATICAPGSTSNCVTVGHLLVDTGSFGLRVLQSEVSSLNLPTINASNGVAAYDCVAFADGSFLWGPVVNSSVTLAGETANNVPIQVISSSTANLPTSCSNGGKNENTQSSLGANGILGVGLEPLDCGAPCDPSGGLSTPPVPAYYSCNSSGCSPQFVSESNQVTNPVVLFAVDNNGVIVELPSVSGSAATVTGSLVFGVGTENDNQLSSAAAANLFTTVCDDFTTIFEGQTFAIDPSSCTGPGSFIDSGSNGLYFPNVNSAIPACPSSTPVGDLSSFYCPSSSLSLSATNQDPTTNYTQTVNFTVDNAENLFTSSSTSTDAAFTGLAGLNPSGAGFDWGLPFFYGKNVYSTIDGQGVPSNLPSPPWWAY